MASTVLLPTVLTKDPLVAEKAQLGRTVFFLQVLFVALVDMSPLWAGRPARMNNTDPQSAGFLLERLTGYGKRGLTYRAFDQNSAHGNGTCLAPSLSERRLRPPACIGRSYRKGPSGLRRFEGERQGTC